MDNKWDRAQYLVQSLIAAFVICFVVAQLRSCEETHFKILEKTYHK